MARQIYKSRNQNRRFINAAKVISGKISQIEGVVGIVATGGIGRGHSDIFSDLDLIVYADSANASAIRKYIAVGFLSYKGISFDTPVESYQKALRSKVPSKYWNQVLRWTLNNSRVLYDTKNRIGAMLEKKIDFPEKERRLLMHDYCHETGEILNYIFPTWEFRGEVYHLAGLIRRAAENIVLWIYAKNRKFQPYLNKWLFYHLENGNVSEARHFNDIKQAYMRPITSLSQARRMRQNLLRLCGKVGMEIEPVDMNEVFGRLRANWDKAPKKTKYYLSF